MPRATITGQRLFGSSIARSRLVSITQKLRRNTGRVPRNVAHHGSGSIRKPKTSNCTAPTGRISRLSTQRRYHGAFDKKYGDDDDDGDGVLVGDENLLHEACRAHPPLDQIEAIVSDRPPCLSELTCRGQTPLHVAAARGASPQVVQYLLKRHPQAAAVADDAGRTPLHLACEKCTQGGDGWCDTGNAYGDKARGPLLRVVRYLCEAAPKSVNFEDDRGVTALEYAIEYGATTKVIRSLHSASKKGWDYKLGRISRKGAKRASAGAKRASEGLIRASKMLGRSAHMLCRPIRRTKSAPQITVAGRIRKSLRKLRRCQTA